jgi:hypothetical protein
LKSDRKILKKIRARKAYQKYPAPLPMLRGLFGSKFAPPQSVRF